MALIALVLLVLHPSQQGRAMVKVRVEVGVERVEVGVGMERVEVGVERVEVGVGCRVKVVVRLCSIVTSMAMLGGGSGGPPMSDLGVRQPPPH